MSETGSVDPLDAPPVPARHTPQPQPPGTDEPAETAAPADAAAEPPRKVVVVQQPARHKGDAATEEPPSSPPTPPPLSLFATPTPQRARRARTPNPKLTIEEQPPAPKRPWAIAWVCLAVAIVIGLLGLMTIASGDEIQDAGSLAEAVPPETLVDDSTCQTILRPDKFPEGEGRYGAVCGGAVYRVDSTEKVDGKYVHTRLAYLPGVTPP